MAQMHIWGNRIRQEITVAKVSRYSSCCSKRVIFILDILHSSTKTIRNPSVSQYASFRVGSSLFLQALRCLISPPSLALERCVWQARGSPLALVKVGPIGDGHWGSRDRNYFRSGAAELHPEPRALGEEHRRG